MLLDQIRKLENLKGRDRLDMVRTIRFVLFTLQRSVAGWNEWVNNPDVMANFSLEELKEISENLAKLTEPFIEYDCEVTSRVEKNTMVKESGTLKEPLKKVRENTGAYYVS